jgi:hypothetical protein
MNNKIVLGVIGAALLGASFYGGVAYGKSGTQTRGQFGDEQFMRMGNGQLQGGGMRGGMGSGLTAGEVIAKDETSITVKMQDGSTQIVLIGASTEVLNTIVGSAADLVVGATVAVTGTTNSDGSVTGQSIQIRPAGSTPFGGMRPNQ